MSGLYEAISKLVAQVVLWAIVSPWEQAIRVRAGKHIRRLPPGVHLRLPVLDTVFKQTVRRRNVMISTQTLCTADGATVVISASLGYEISDIEVLYRTLHHAEDTLRQIASAVLAAAVLKRSRSDLQSEQLGREVSQELAATFSSYGIAGVEVRVTDFAFIRAIRLIQDARWANGDSIDMEPAK